MASACPGRACKRRSGSHPPWLPDLPPFPPANSVEVEPLGARTNRRLGRRIAACRSAAGATLADTADRVGVSLQILQRYETGEVGLTIGRLVRICQALEVPAAAMLHGIVDAPKPGEDDADMGVQFARILGRLPQAKRLAVLALVREMAR